MDYSKFSISGMDITLTTPLEMGVGQQKYVVAYTLKQGVEKQPDILIAQKSTSENIDSVQKMGSPAAIRPDALFNTSSSSSSSKPLKASPYELQQKSATPTSHQGTLSRNDANKSYMPLNQTLTNNYGTQPPPYCSTMMSEYDYETPLNYPVNYGATAANASNFHKMSPDYNNLNSLISGANNPNSVPNGLAVSQDLPDSYIEFERTTLDHRLLNSSTNNTNTSSHNHLNNNNKDNNLEYLNRVNGPTNPFSAAAQEYSDSEPIDYKNIANQIATTISNINSTLNRSRNRNHIVTDTLPGPESCV